MWVCEQRGSAVRNWSGVEGHDTAHDVIVWRLWLEAVRDQHRVRLADSFSGSCHGKLVTLTMGVHTQPHTQRHGLGFWI